MPVFSYIDERTHFTWVEYICDNNKLPVIYKLMVLDMLEHLSISGQF